MTEKILLLPGANGTELIRMLARFGKNTLGLRILNATEFARLALMRSGIFPEEDFLTRRQEAIILDGILRDIPYFASAAYADAEKMADALFSLRSLIPEKEAETLRDLLPNGEFPEKNLSILQVYDRYIDALQKLNNLDTVGLLRKAMAEAAPFSCPVYTLEEYPLSPLENALADRLSPDRTESSLCQLLQVTPGTPKNMDYTESYGDVNEVEAICSYITEQGLPFDQCIVAVTDTAHYARLFHDFSKTHGIPVSFGCGIPILNTNPAKLLKLLLDWSTNGYFGVDGLRTLLSSEAMDRKKLLDDLSLSHMWQLEEVIAIAGQLRLGFDKAENDRRLAGLDPAGEYYAATAAFSEALSLGYGGWIEKYALIRDGDAHGADQSARSAICQALDTYAKYTGGEAPEPIIPQLLQRSVAGESSRAGALFVTGISGALASMRKHLFIAGMSAARFPGMPRENYLLLDSDYALFPQNASAPTSVQRITEKRRILDRVLALAGGLGVSVHISYSAYDLAELKEMNPSSVLFDIFRQQMGEKATLEEYKNSFRKTGYFAREDIFSHGVGRAYIAGKTIGTHKADLSEMPCGHEPKRAFSPSAIGDFFSCPRKFFLKYILDIWEEEADDPFQVIDGKSLGTLAHKVMENYAHAPCSREEFLERAEKLFDDFLLTRPPLLQDAADREKAEFCKMMAIAYDNDPGNKVLSSEEEQIFEHKASGLKLRGYPDRVEQTPSGEHIIADFKTAKYFSHIQDDALSCLQVLIYAYLLEQKGVKIHHCEYRYLRYGEPITCRYDDDMRHQLDQLLLIFKNALDTGDFPLTNVPDNCRYCKFSNICGKNTTAEEDAE